MAILASIYNSDLMKSIRKANYSGDLIRYLLETIISSGFFLALCFLYYLRVNIYHWQLLVAAIAGIYSFICLIRVTIVTALILKKLS